MYELVVYASDRETIGRLGELARREPAVTTTEIWQKGVNPRLPGLMTLVEAWERPPTLHFVGFKDDRVWHAVRIFGWPDFFHRHWDERARAEIVEGDVAIFADGNIEDQPTPFAWNDSERF